MKKTADKSSVLLTFSKNKFWWNNPWLKDNCKYASQEQSGEQLVREKHLQECICYSWEQGGERRKRTVSLKPWREDMKDQTSYPLGKYQQNRENRGRKRKRKNNSTDREDKTELYKKVWLCHRKKLVGKRTFRGQLTPFLCCFSIYLIF